MSGLVCGWVDKFIGVDRWMGLWMDGWWIDGWMDGWWIDGWVVMEVNGWVGR